MAKVTDVPFTSRGPRFRGEFKVERFNLFEDEDLKRYSTLRTQGNDASSGVQIDMIREYTRKTTTYEGEGKEQIVTNTEEIFVLVHYWLKKPSRREESNEDKEEARWALEKSAS